MPIAAAAPARPATSGSANRRRSLSSPRSNSRRASRPTTKKKNVIRPLLTQSRRSSVNPAWPMRIASSVVHTDSYEWASTLTQTSAAATAPRSAAAPALSVSRNSRSGVGSARAQAVRWVNGAASGALASDVTEQPAFIDDLEPQRPIAVLVEEHHDRVVAVALDGAVAELRVTDARSDLERMPSRVGVCPPRVAVVAVAARRREGFPEVAEDVLPPAARCLRITAHHLDAGPLVLLSAVLRRRGDFSGVGDRHCTVALRDVAVRQQRQEAGVREPSESGDDLCLGQVRDVVQRACVDRPVGLLDGFGDDERLVDRELAAAGEEAP